jgi:hypothetical protein
MALADELTKLAELHRSGALTDSEFAKAKEALLASPQIVPAAAPGLDAGEQKRANELARLDREWEMAREQFLIANRYGIKQVPTIGMGIGTMVVGGVFGTFWTIVAFAMTRSAPDIGPFLIIKVVFPLFGLVFIGAALGYGGYCYVRAQKYERAFEAYRTRRLELVGSDPPFGSE